MAQNTQDFYAELEGVDFSVCIEDTSKLLQQMQESPLIFFKFSCVYEDSKRKVADLKLKCRIIEAEIAKKLRTENPKISEAKIDKSYFEFEEYVTLNKKLNEAKHKEGKFYAVIKTLEQRHAILITGASLIKSELRKNM